MNKADHKTQLLFFFYLFGIVAPAPASLALCPILSIWDCLDLLTNKLFNHLLISSSIPALIIHISKHSYNQTTKMSQGNQTVRNINVQPNDQDPFSVSQEFVCFPHYLSHSCFPL